MRSLSRRIRWLSYPVVFIAYTATPQGSVCSTAHCFMLGPAVVAYLITITATISDLTVSFVAVCAQLAGLPFARSQQQTPRETGQHVSPRSGLSDEQG